MDSQTTSSLRATGVQKIWREKKSQRHFGWSKYDGAERMYVSIVNVKKLNACLQFRVTFSGPNQKKMLRV